MSFHPQRVRASTKSYLRFTLAMGRSPGFGSTPDNYFALFRLAFATAPDLKPLTSLPSVTHRLIMQKARRQRPSLLRLLVSTRFQVLFHSPPGVLFTFPSRYWFTIGRQEYLALEGGPPWFLRGFPCPAVLGMSPDVRSTFRVQDSYLLWWAFPEPFR